MKNFKIISLVLLIVLAIYVVFTQPGGSYAKDESNEPENVPAFSSELTEAYTDYELGFAFAYPAGYVVANTKTERGETKLSLQNALTQTEIQILITPRREPDMDVTYENIRTRIPDLRINNPQTLEIGANRKGLAFESNNPAFSGASREVWFIFRGNFYQISAPETHDGLLRAVFGTWTFL